MRVLQINALYSKLSTGRTTREMHEYLQTQGIDSFVASPDLAGLSKNSFQIGGTTDHKIHAVLTRFTGKQGHYSTLATKKLLAWMSCISPDIVILRNLHSNYINLPLLLKYLADKNIATVIVLHDSWFITGGCTYYVTSRCDKWKTNCRNCPVPSFNINSLFLKPTQRMLLERENLFASIKRLAVVGVSQWVAEDAKLSIVKKAFSIECIYNWINLKLFCPKDKVKLKDKYGFSKESFIVLGVSAGWSEAKGINVFHGLADILTNDYQIVLVGDYASIDLKKNIKYIPRTSNLDQLSELYAMADVFVNPTVQETFGKTTAEALSSGTPVVAYDGTATPELVGRDEMCGFLIQGLDPLDYAKRIQLIKECGVDEYSDRCRKRALMLFDMSKNMRRYIDLFDRLLDEGDQ